MNGDDSGRFPTKGEGVRVPGPVKRETRRSCAGSGRCFSKG